VSTPLASSSELGIYLDTEVDLARALLLLQLAQDRCETIVAPLPAAAKGVVLAVAARAYDNITSRLSEVVGGISQGAAPTAMGGVGGLYLSKSDKADLRRMAGRSTAFSIDTLPKGVDAVQTVIVQGSPTGGTFTLAFGGVPTNPVALDADAPTLQAALEAVGGIGAGNVTVSGASGAWAVTFTGALGTSPMPLLVAADTFTGGTTPYVQVLTLVTGVLAPGQGLPGWDVDHYGPNSRSVAVDGF
jgi:hypothetical protein